MTSPGAFAAVDALLKHSVEQSVFPGAVALVAGRGGILHQVAVGRHTYDPSSPLMSVEHTLFDVASLTKVTATTTVAMLLYQAGTLSLDALVADAFGPDFANSDPRKESMTVRNLLLHNAGFPPDPTPNFCTPSFGCLEEHLPPQQRKLAFSCQAQILAAVNAQHLDRVPGARNARRPRRPRSLAPSSHHRVLPLPASLSELPVRPVATAASRLHQHLPPPSRAGLAEVYSDLSMVTLSLLLGRLVRTTGRVGEAELRADCAAAAATAAAVAAAKLTGGAGRGPQRQLVQPIDQCYYEAYARTAVFSRLTDDPSRFVGFRPPRALWSRAAPTWNDTTSGFPGECVLPFRQRLLQGEVSDGNSYAAGGVAGHAGVFASAAELHALAAGLLFAPSAASDSRLGVNCTTAALFTRAHNLSQSSRALGWDTNDYVANSYRGCANLSATTFTHTGYTGTQICADPGRELITVLLTNRVYPDADEMSLHKIHAARQAFNNAVKDAVDGPTPTPTPTQFPTPTPTPTQTQTQTQRRR